MEENSWITLTGRYGNTIQDPKFHDVEKAIDEVVNRKDDEHPNAWLSYGTSDDKLYTIDYYNSGLLIISLYNDQDYEDLVYEREYPKTEKEKALEIMKLLIESKFDKIDSISV